MTTAPPPGGGGQHPSTPLDIDAEPALLGSSDTPEQPVTVAYDPSPQREKVRTGLAIGLAIVTVLIGATLLVTALLKLVADINPLLTGIFTPFFGLTGTIIGFYFGGNDPTRRK